MMGIATCYASPRDYKQIAELADKDVTEVKEFAQRKEAVLLVAYMKGARRHVLGCCFATTGVLKMSIHVLSYKDDGIIGEYVHSAMIRSMKSIMDAKKQACLVAYIKRTTIPMFSSQGFIAVRNYMDGGQECSYVKYMKDDEWIGSCIIQRILSGDCRTLIEV